MAIEYSVSYYLHGKRNKQYSGLDEFIYDVLCDIYPNRRKTITGFNMEEKTVLDKNTQVSLVSRKNGSEYHVYVLMKLGRKQYNLDILHFKTVTPTDKHWNIVKDSSHHYIFSYLNINHNPNFLTAPEYIVKACLKCTECFNESGNRWLIKMDKIIESQNKRNSVKKIINNNNDLGFLLHAASIAQYKTEQKNQNKSNHLKQTINGLNTHSKPLGSSNQPLFVTMMQNK